MFKYAIVRKPGQNFSKGQSTVHLGEADYQKALEQHSQYCEALKKCGLELTMLEADSYFPDGCFVEDTAVVTEKVAIITFPSAITRFGEENEIAKLLFKQRKIEFITGEGRLEGGDVMMVNNHFYIGLSKRTNLEGANQLAAILARHDYTSSTVPVETVLHLKTGITYIGNNTFVSNAEFAKKFSEFNVIQTSPAEEYAANCLLINDYLLMPSGFPELKIKLQSMGYSILEVDMSEYMKMDGALTCLSLRF
jgi:dimethylargininase